MLEPNLKVMRTYHDNNQMNTLMECMNNLVQRGYSSNFVVVDNGNAIKSDKDAYCNPTQVKISSFYRFEGDSDPADSAILYAIETKDGEKGFLTTAYGPYADAEVANFIRKVEDICKRSAHCGTLWSKLKGIFYSF